MRQRTKQCDKALETCQPQTEPKQRAVYSAKQNQSNLHPPAHDGQRQISTSHACRDTKQLTILPFKTIKQAKKEQRQTRHHEAKHRRTGFEPVTSA